MTQQHHRELPRVGITLGDPAGIGPEILARMLSHEAIEGFCVPIVIGDARVLGQGFEIIGEEPDLVHIDDPDEATPGRRYLYDLGNISPEDYVLGEASAAAGRASGEFIERAIRFAMNGQLDAVVTNPINKVAFTKGGWGKRFAGHTEMFTELCGARDTCMMLLSGPLRVCHVTTHVSLLDALTTWITSERIGRVIDLADRACGALGIESPRIGVAAVNPHASEGGLFGSEEARVIEPAIVAARGRGVHADGPVPADTLFSKAAGGMYDAVVAMYHDQGHIPVKLHGFRYEHEGNRWQMEGVNVTLGLPIIRTSVNHGTAYDRAGKGSSAHNSLLEALQVAVTMARGARRP